MNERRACQLLLAPYILFQLADDKEDYKSVRISNYIMALGRKIESDQAKLFKIAKRTFKKVQEILIFSSDEGRFSGMKIVLMLFHLTQMIFDAKANEPLDEKSQFLLKKIYAVMEYVLYLENQERYLKLDSEADFEKLEKSASKLAEKVFEKYYKTI